MKILVFGASGKVGRIFVEKALSEGNKVIAFVHGPTDLNQSGNLELVQGDVYDSVSVESAVARAEVVVSALGSWGTARKDVLSSGMKNIIPAMKTHGIQRIISLTGHDARAPGDTFSIINRMTRPFLMLIAPKILIDGEEHIRLLDRSSLDWTVVRSPVMNERGSSGYQLTLKRPMPWQTINRHAVAQAMLEQCTSQTSIKTAPYIVR